MLARVALASVVLAAATACARERIEVGEAEQDDVAAAIDGEPAIFDTGDAGPDALLTTCGPPPPLGRCATSCPDGYLTLDDGAVTCCCL